MLSRLLFLVHPADTHAMRNPTLRVHLCVCANIDRAERHAARNVWESSGQICIPVSGFKGDTHRGIVLSTPPCGLVCAADWADAAMRFSSPALQNQSPRELASKRNEKSDIAPLLKKTKQALFFVVCDNVRCQDTKRGFFKGSAFIEMIQRRALWQNGPNQSCIFECSLFLRSF